MDTIPLSLPILMDGATGTELQKRGMPAGVCTERWALEHPETLLERIVNFRPWYQFL